MKYSTYITGITYLAIFASTNVVAFPSRMFDLSMNEKEKRVLAAISEKIESSSKQETRELKRVPGFSASQQYISNTGDHTFVPPGKNDLRGPCPGLNAMANHNYLPHNGVATISQFVQGTYDGMYYNYSIFYITNY